jgi:hypothetical protein
MRKTDYFYCSECRMRQPVPFNYKCNFCGCEFSNYESMMEELYKDIFRDEVSN